MTFHHTTRRLALFSASVFLLAILCTFFNATAQENTQTDIRQLHSSEPIERALASGQTHSYKIALRSGQYVNISVEQFGINAEVILAEPKGSQITSIDWWWREGTESYWAAAESSGDYTLKIISSAQPVETGKYRLRLAKIETWAEAPENDRDLITAYQEFAQGKRLRETPATRREAIEKYRSALALWRKLKNDNAAGLTLIEIALTEYQSGNLKAAGENVQLAIPLFQASANRREEANALFNLGVVHNFSGQPQKALETYSQALPLARAINEPALEVKILGGLGPVLHLLGQTNKALGTLNEGVSLARRTSNIEGEASLHNNLGFIYVNLGQLRDAVGHFSQTLSLLEINDNRFGRAATLANLGDVYSRTGEFQKALDSLLRGLQLTRSTGDRRREAITLIGIGRLYLRLGDYDRAQQYCDEALTLTRAIGTRDFESDALLNLGSISGRTGELPKAIEYFNEALTIKIQVGDRYSQALALNNLGMVYGRLEQPEKALDYYDKALTIRREIGDQYGESQTLSTIGAAYLQLGNWSKAREHSTTSLELALKTGDRLGEVATLYQLAQIEKHDGNFSEARSRIEAALVVVEATRTKVSLADVRSIYFASRQDLFVFYIDLLIQMNSSQGHQEYLPEAFHANERRIARSLLDSVGDARTDIRTGVSQDLLEREQRVKQDLNAKADQQIRLLSRKHPAEQAKAIVKELERLTTEYEQVLAQIRQASPRYAALTQPSPASLKQIQQEVLDSDSLLLEYILGEERSYLFAITDKSITSYELPKRSEIETETRRVHDLIVNKADAVQPEVLIRLSQMLLGPVASKLGRKRLVIVAQGPLQYLSFGALPTPTSPERGGPPSRQGVRSATGEPLLTNHEIVSLPSTSVMVEFRRDLSRRKRAARKLIVLADPVFAEDDPRIKDGVKTSSTEQTDKNDTDDKSVSDVVRSANDVNLVRFDRLPLSRREAELITAGIPKDQFLQVLDFSANRAAATNPDVGQFQIVHFATHSLINNRHPELSGIVLSLVDDQGRPQDGFLRLHEIYNLKLGADLVVLSACQTALGKDIRGEGLIGLTRGFMYAGAPRVVATLWKVSDSATAEFMSRFYQNMLRKGMSPAASLRAAQLSLRREKQWAAPYYWAGFVLQGEWR